MLAASCVQHETGFRQNSAPRTEPARWESDCSQEDGSRAVQRGLVSLPWSKGALKVLGDAAEAPALFKQSIQFTCLNFTSNS